MHKKVVRSCITYVEHGEKLICGNTVKVRQTKYPKFQRIQPPTVPQIKRKWKATRTICINSFPFSLPNCKLSRHVTGDIIISYFKKRHPEKNKHCIMFAAFSILLKPNGINCRGVASCASRTRTHKITIEWGPVPKQDLQVTAAAKNAHINDSRKKANHNCGRVNLPLNGGLYVSTIIIWDGSVS